MLPFSISLNIQWPVAPFLEKILKIKLQAKEVYFWVSWICVSVCWVDFVSIDTFFLMAI